MKIGNEIASLTGNGANPQLHNQLIEIKSLVENKNNFDTSLWFLGKVIYFFKFDKSKFDHGKENLVTKLSRFILTRFLIQ